MNRITAVIGFCASSLIWGAGTAHADANSYLSYLQDHQVFTAFNSQSKNLQAGFYACQALHAGQTPEQVAASSPPMFISVDVRGMIDAAQHELCPDTLGH